MLVFAGAADGIAPVASVKASVPLLTGARDVRFEIVPGGHLGMLTGRKARTSTWLVLDEWIDQWSEPEAPAAPAAGVRPRRRPPPRRPRTKKATAKKAPARKAATKMAPAARKPAEKRVLRAADRGETSTEAAEIGTNPTRRYGSAGSRALGGR